MQIKKYLAEDSCPIIYSTFNNTANTNCLVAEVNWRARANSSNPYPQSLLSELVCSGEEWHERQCKKIWLTGQGEMKKKVRGALLSGKKI